MKTKAPVLSGAIRNTVPGVLAGEAASPAGAGDGVGVGVAAGTIPACTMPFMMCLQTVSATSDVEYDGSKAGCRLTLAMSM
jgi:hypothetical protein